MDSKFTYFRPNRDSILATASLPQTALPTPFSLLVIVPCWRNACMRWWSVLLNQLPVYTKQAEPYARRDSSGTTLK